MTRTLTLLAAALLLAPATLLAQVDRREQAAQAPAAEDFRNLTDAQFLQRAAIGGIMEVATSKVADDRSENETVENYAEKMVEDHNAANRELVSLAESKGIDIPKTLDDNRKAMLDRMGEMEGPALAREYAQHQLAHHRQSIALFTAMAEHADDADIKAFAQKQVPILRRHLEMAEALAGR